MPGPCIATRQNCDYNIEGLLTQLMDLKSEILFIQLLFIKRVIKVALVLPLLPHCCKALKTLYDSPYLTRFSSTRIVFFSHKLVTCPNSKSH